MESGTKNIDSCNQHNASQSETCNQEINELTGKQS